MGVLWGFEECAGSDEPIVKSTTQTHKATPTQAQQEKAKLHKIRTFSSSASFFVTQASMNKLKFFLVKIKNWKLYKRNETKVTWVSLCNDAMI